MFKISFLKFASLIFLFLVCHAPEGVMAQAQPLFEGGGLSIPGLQEGQPKDPKITISFDKQDVAAGDELTATIKIDLHGNKEAYVYSQKPNHGAGSKIQLTSIAGLEPIDQAFKASKKPKTVIEPLFDNAKLEKFFTGVTWTQTFRVTGQAAPQLKGELRFQVCDDQNCTQFAEPINLTANLSGTSEGPANLKMIFSETDSEDDQVMEVITNVRVIDGVNLKPEREFGGADPIEFDIWLTRLTEEGQAPEQVAIVIQTTLEGEWHLYAQTQDPEMFGIPTQIKLEQLAGLTPIDDSFRPTSKPEMTKPEPDIIQQVFHHQVTWQRRFEVDPDGLQGPIDGSILYQLCEEGGSCLPPHTVTFTLNGNGQSNETVKPLLAADTPVDQDSTVPVEDSIPISSQGLIPFIITGITFGYLALLTPCVFPMIPITVSFFLKQAEKEHHNPLWMATIYCLGIVGTFTFIGVVVSALFGGTQMSQIANDTWLNLFLSAVLVFFGLNMLGMFEIRVPSWLLSWSSKKEGQGGIIGVLFMAFTFTLVSFTCTFAFVGLLMPMASQGDYYWPIIGMLAFSSAFASPFFFLALFPSYLKKLPQSGGWMNNVKVTFGLLEIGAAFKFLSVADTNMFSQPFIFDYALVMTSWMVLCIVAGLYLLGLFRLPHDTPTDSISVIRLGFAMSFLGFAAYLSSGIYSPTKPEGVIWEQVAAFAPPSFERTEDVELGPALEHDDLLYALDVDQAIEFAEANRLPMFFDFTGVNCVNCRAMEVTVFPQKEVHQLLENFVRVQLYTDTIPTFKDSDRAEILLEKNRRLQTEWFKDVSLPAYAVVTPDGQTILSSYKGKERSDGQFTRFLKSGLEAWQQRTAQQETTIRK